ncbi:MAG: hypothetical protein ABIA04_06405 [Pseudomonadota bacterium]
MIKKLALLSLLILVILCSCGNNDIETAIHAAVAAEDNLIIVSGNLNHQEIIDQFLLTPADNLVLRNSFLSRYFDTIAPEDLEINISLTPVTQDSELKTLNVTTVKNYAVSAQDNEDGNFELYLFPEVTYMIEFYIETRDEDYYLGTLNSASRYTVKFSSSDNNFELGKISFSDDASSENAAPTASITSQEITDGLLVNYSVLDTAQITRLSLEGTEQADETINLSEYISNLDVSYIIKSNSLPAFCTIDKNDSGDYILSLSYTSDAGNFKFPILLFNEQSINIGALYINLTIIETE